MAKRLRAEDNPSTISSPLAKTHPWTQLAYPYSERVFNVAFRVTCLSMPKNTVNRKVQR